ncbi:MAG: glycerol-3-phosphate dehydrogenase [Terriglobia bacterium]
MKRSPEAWSQTTFDLVVIGGGINGAATAREAALRGLKVALFEARDFAIGASSRSSKLIHGGLRYLAQGEFKLVREARLERRRLAQLAPHLARPLAFLLPIYRGDPFSPWKMRLGLTLYDWMGSLGAQDRHRSCNAHETLRRLPALQPAGLRAGAIYHDSLTSDARLTLENVLGAAVHGAVIANYAEVRSFARRPRASAISEAEVLDRITGKTYEVASRLWINATGAWVDGLRALVPGHDGSRTVRLTKGTHVILPCLSPDYALFGAIRPGERIFLMMPWRGYSLLGTTDTDYDGDPAAVAPDCADVDYLLRAVNRVLRDPVEKSSVVAAYAGLRALTVQPGSSPSANTREYRFHRDPWAENMIAICGGKLTTARSLAEKLVDLALAELPAGAAGSGNTRSSREVRLPGGHTGPFPEFLRSAREEAQNDFGVPAKAAKRIVETYGSRWRDVLDSIRSRPDLAEVLPGEPELLAAEVRFAIREEMAITMEDFLLRRSGLSWLACSWPDMASRVAEIFAGECGWPPEARDSALRKFERSAAVAAMSPSPCSGRARMPQ